MLQTRRVWVPPEYETAYSIGSRWGVRVKLHSGYYKWEPYEIDPRLIHDAVLPEVVGDYDPIGVE